MSRSGSVRVVGEAGAEAELAERAHQAHDLAGDTEVGVEHDAEVARQADQRGGVRAEADERLPSRTALFPNARRAPTPAKPRSKAEVSKIASPVTMAIAASAA